MSMELQETGNLVLMKLKINEARVKRSSRQLLYVVIESSSGARTGVLKRYIHRRWLLEKVNSRTLQEGVGLNMFSPTMSMLEMTQREFLK